MRNVATALAPDAFELLESTAETLTFLEGGVETTRAIVCIVSARVSQGATNLSVRPQSRITKVFDNVLNAATKAQPCQTCDKIDEVILLTTLFGVDWSSSCGHAFHRAGDRDRHQPCNVHTHQIKYDVLDAAVANIVLLTVCGIERVEDPTTSFP